VRNALLSLSADDGGELGQVYRLHFEGDLIHFRFKFPKTPEPRGRSDWAWTEEVVIPSPKILVERLAKGWEPKAPNLRLATVKGGERVVLLDFVIETHTPPLLPPKGNILAYDWGVRRLVTLVILDREGKRISPPLFLLAGGMEGKQARLRAQIDALIEKRDKLPEGSPKRLLLQAEIENCWRKYRARNRAISHIASSFIVLMAVLYECDTIVGEWLKTLKVRKKKWGRGKKARWRNWRTSTTVRQAIWSKVEYKAALFGIRTRTILPRGTSHECPRCGKKGITTLSPEHKESIKWGRWFKCLHCGYNCDRDYVAGVNIGLRWLKRGARKEKPVSYIGAGAALPFPSPDKGRVRSQVLTTLRGARKAVRLKPSYPLLF
jgi:transposase